MEGTGGRGQTVQMRSARSHRGREVHNMLSVRPAVRCLYDGRTYTHTLAPDRAMGYELLDQDVAPQTRHEGAFGPRWGDVS